MKKLKYRVEVSYHNFDFDDCNEALQFAIKAKRHAETDDVDVEIYLFFEEEKAETETETKIESEAE